MYFAASADVSVVEREVHVGDEVLDGSAAPKRDGSDLVSCVDCHKASCIRYRGSGRLPLVKSILSRLYL